MQTNNYKIDGRKMYTELRKRLASLDLPASACAVYTAVHFACDKDTGEFDRYLTEIARIAKISRQTVWNGFNALLDVGLVIHVSDNTYKIVGYESYRVNGGSYFRIPIQFLDVLANCVRHRAGDAIVWALQQFDQARNEDAQMKFSKKRMKDYLGPVLSRVKAKLHMLTDVIKFWQDTRGNFYFSSAVKEAFTEEQVQLRRLNGKLSQIITQRFIDSIGSRALKRKQLQSLVMYMIEWSIYRKLDHKTMELLAGAIGFAMAKTTAAGELIENPIAYFAKAGHSLLKQYMRSKGTLLDQPLEV